MGARLQKRNEQLEREVCYRLRDTQSLLSFVLVASGSGTYRPFIAEEASPSLLPFLQRQPSSEASHYIEELGPQLLAVFQIRVDGVAHIWITRTGPNQGAQSPLPKSSRTDVCLS